MFTWKKTQLPSRPEIPPIDDILKDLENVMKDDVVISVSPTSLCSHSLSESSGHLSTSSQSEAESKDTVDIQNKDSSSFSDSDLEPEEAFQKVKQFFDLNKKIEKSLELLQCHTDKLQDVTEHLSEEIAVISDSVHSVT
ncbi:uncharacterized protein LOC106459987 [Limulus polyphemus]|uniref:Uncharacterized protein LOC106459987 n=1 Tax=Limulus polyphemus TaxID=6850 RepID=A0ABM1B5B6_LIMPO|nr:uncharacterized protein LOC106459987 [Limulus polyphemus]XP_013775119.1 uncharacterized protein LOC106459987 [Limulus polyphemus]XP_022242279.1 uncharacterized protein LOC106459987 [Limulus polyphemus]XP_022242280.1 uncharacterized protein LOC106459987 [Limulus polyphemus]XP_022242281.1 uncharacterized protein LOC106459987 [Limulus polyphemus]